MTAEKKLKLMLLINWREEGKWSFLQFLKSRKHSIRILQPVSLKHVESPKITYISNYLSELYVPLAALFHRNSVDVVVSWQMRIGVFYGLFKRLLHPGKPPLHIVQDFHIDLTKPTRLYRLQIAFMKLALPGIDHFCCNSTEEEAIYSEMFGIPRDRIRFLPQISPIRWHRMSSGTVGNHIFSYGNSDRDFDTLVHAVSGLSIPTVILSQKYMPQVPLPKHVTIIRNRISENELIDWLATSRMVVIPMQDYRIAAGQISLLEAMSLGKPVVVARNMATREYAVHKESALFYEPGNSQYLSACIRYLWDSESAANEIGIWAKQACLHHIETRATLFTELLEKCAKTWDTVEGIARNRRAELGVPGEK
jgi:glycosyltransferase involved in cell wall biosynthesis